MQSNFENENLAFNFNYFFGVIRRHINLIILSVILFGIVSFYYTITVQHVYNSTTSILINSNAGTSAAVFDLTGNSKNIQLENEKQMIVSRLVSELTIKKLWESEDRNNLHLFNTRKFIPRAMDERRYIKEILTLGFYEPTKSQALILDEHYTLDTLRLYSKKMTENLVVQNKRNSDVIILAYKSPFPDEAALILNRVVESYIQIDKVWGTNQAQSVLTFVESQSKKIEKKLLASEEKLKMFKEQHGIFDLSGNSELILTELINTESQLYRLNAQAKIIEEQRKYLNSELSEDEKSLANQVTNSINLKVFALRSKISEKEADLITSREQHGEDHEVVIKAVKAIDILKKNLASEVEKQIAQGLVVADPIIHRNERIQELLLVEQELATVKVQVEQYEELVSNYDDQLYLLPSLQLSFARLERESSVLNQTYLFLRQKLEESKIQVATESGKLQVIDSAIENTKRNSPDHKLNIFIGLLMGMLFSGLLILIIEYFDKTLKSMDDLDKSLVILGIIPSITSSKHKHSSRFSFRYFLRRIKHYKEVFDSKKNIFSQGSVIPTRHLITHTDPKSPVSEAYRSLRTSLSYSSVDDAEFKSLIISSTGPGEGKTTTISNLAITYANLGKKVLLIDTDLRRPVLHKVFKIENKTHGITSYLTGNEDNISSLINKTEVENLSLITSGIIPPNPSELLASERMKDLILNLKNDWDMVLLDSPPLIAVTDAAILSKSVDKLAIVVMPGKTDKKALSHALKSLDNMDSNISGVIFNGVDSKNSYGSYYYYYQYYNYYGTTEE